MRPADNLNRPFFYIIRQFSFIALPYQSVSGTTSTAHLFCFNIVST